jgi:hypothetical protein
LHSPKIPEKYNFEMLDKPPSEDNCQLSFKLSVEKQPGKKCRLLAVAKTFLVLARGHKKFGRQHFPYLSAQGFCNFASNSHVSWQRSSFAEYTVRSYRRPAGLMIRTLYSAKELSSILSRDKAFEGVSS